jgi:hypothetical protein
MRHSVVIVGSIAMMAGFVVVDALFGRVTAVLSLGIAYPAYLAVAFYLLDVKERARKQDD